MAAMFIQTLIRPPGWHLSPCRCKRPVVWHETEADVAAGDGLAEISVQAEGRDMWRVHLGRGAYQAAFRAASTQGQRNVVNVAEADAALESGDTKHAARLYGKVRLHIVPFIVHNILHYFWQSRDGSNKSGHDGLQVTAALPSFEEVALKLVDSGDANALQIFLLTKLQVLGSEDKAQAHLPFPSCCTLHTVHQFGTLRTCKQKVYATSVLILYAHLCNDYHVFTADQARQPGMSSLIFGPALCSAGDTGGQLAERAIPGSDQSCCIGRRHSCTAICHHLACAFRREAWHPAPVFPCHSCRGGILHTVML